MSIPLEYIIINCQDRAKYRRRDDGKITGFSIATSDEILNMDAEGAKVVWLVPQLSREGKKRIKEVFSHHPILDVGFDYVKRDIAERTYLKPGEMFSVPKGKKLARITATKLALGPESLPITAEIDIILGFPTNKAEKPYYKPED